MNLKENLRLARLFFLLLAIVTAGRWIMSLKQVPYEKGTFIFSIVTLTLFSSVYYAAFARRWKGYGIAKAMVLAMTLAFSAQLVILLSTFATYALGMDSYFNHPSALLGPQADVTQRVAFGQALTARFFGLAINTLLSSVSGALGWAMGGLLPEK